MLFSAYRRDDFADPEGFVAQLGMVLSDFSDEVVIYVTGPRTGLQRRSKWPPSISEVVEACEDHRDYLAKVHSAKRAAPLLLEAPAAAPGDLAQVFVPDSHQRYRKLVDWTTTADARLWKFGRSGDGRVGIWVAWSAWEFQPTAALAQAAAEPTSLNLSEATRKVMRDIDAERHGMLRADQEAAE